MPFANDIYYHAFAGSAEGQRPPLVMLHGAAGSHLSWPPEVRRLPGYRTYALDLPGHGKSGGRGMQSIAAFAEAVAAWLPAVGLHRAVFIGHSMGSAIAATLALDYSEHVLALALIGSGPRLAVNPALLDHASSPTTYQNAIDTVVEWSFGSGAPALLPQLVSKRMAETRSSVLYSDFLACSAYDESARIDGIGCPTLVMCGVEDRMTPLRHSQYLANHIPGAQLKVIDSAGHMAQLEQPRAVAGALSEFLMDIPY
ncbi:MAG: alpha/beta fold hydrolase [Chloroflexota bacterium]